MLDEESKIRALADNYDLDFLLEESDVRVMHVIKYLVDEGFLDLDDYFNFDAEIEEWRRLEE
jgi:glyoxylate carboligase|tara:strand:- start:693 stop:878 length:186 start_codon:yes stop_codon:yes gene_type:complete